MADQPEVARSFYFFDFDKNIMKVVVPFVLRNTTTGELKEIPASQYMQIQSQLGQPGPWQDWSGDHAMMYYSDLPGLPPEQQPFVKQIEAAIATGNPAGWQAPAFQVFVHACNAGREVSLITARGHSDATVRAGFDVLLQHKYIERAPEFLTIYNVTNPDTMKALGDPDGALPVPELKLKAIEATVAVAVQRYGAAPAHRFGMSDDTMQNVEFIADAMRACKQAHPNMRFFVIVTNLEHELKAEIFPMNEPVTGQPPASDPLGHPA